MFFTVELQWYLKYICITEMHFFSFAVHIYWTCDLLVSLNKLLMILWKKERKQKQRQVKAQETCNCTLIGDEQWSTHDMMS